MKKYWKLSAAALLCAACFAPGVRAEEPAPPAAAQADSAVLSRTTHGREMLQRTEADNTDSARTKRALLAALRACVGLAK